VKTSPYYVSYEASTPDERGPGWFWGFEDDEGREQIRGPYFTRCDAEDAIERVHAKRKAP
jgi:hypothetical protein